MSGLRDRSDVERRWIGRNRNRAREWLSGFGIDRIRGGRRRRIERDRRPVGDGAARRRCRSRVRPAGSGQRPGFAGTRNAGARDVRAVWSWNRHHFSPLLARAMDLRSSRRGLSIFGSLQPKRTNRLGPAGQAASAALPRFRHPEPVGRGSRFAHRSLPRRGSVEQNRLRRNGFPGRFRARRRKRKGRQKCLLVLVRWEVVQLDLSSLHSRETIRELPPRPFFETMITRQRWRLILGSSVRAVRNPSRWMLAKSPHYRTSEVAADGFFNPAPRGRRATTGHRCHPGRPRRSDRTRCRPP